MFRPKPRTAVAPVGSGIDLFEWSEDALLVLTGDTEAGVRNHQSYRVVGIEIAALKLDPGFGLLDPQRHLASLGELDRIRQQIVQDLLGALPVRQNSRGNSCRDFGDQAKALVAGQRQEHPLDRLDEIIEGQGRDADLVLAGLDLREIKDLVDERQQISTRRSRPYWRTRPACRSSCRRRCSPEDSTGAACC